MHLFCAFLAARFPSIFTIQNSTKSWANPGLFRHTFKQQLMLHYKFIVKNQMV
jgi:hypothetical protein